MGEVPRWAWGVLIATAVVLRGLLVYGSPTPFGYVFDFYHEGVALFYATGSLPASTDCWQCYHPPLFYLLGLPLYSAGMAWGGDETIALRALSLLPLCCAAGVVVMSLLLLRLYGAGAREVFVGTAIALCFPLLFFSSYASEADVVLAALLSVFLYALCAWHLEPREGGMGRAFGLGALAGLAAATKYSGLVALLLAGAIVALRFATLPEQRARVLRNGLLIATVAIALGSFKYVDNWIRYDTPLFANGTALRGFSAGERTLHWDRYDFGSLEPAALFEALPPDPPLGRLTDLDVYRSVWTALYAQAWGDMSMFSEPSRHGTGVGWYPPRGVPRWLSVAVLVLGLGSLPLVAAGGLVSWRRREALPLLLSFAFTACSYFYWVVAQPSWALKSKYLLFLLPAALVLGMLGARATLARFPAFRRPLLAWVATLVLFANAYLLLFALGRPAPVLQVPARVSAGGFVELGNAGRGFSYEPAAEPVSSFTYELLVRPAAVAAAGRAGQKAVLLVERGGFGENLIVLSGAGTLGFVFHDGRGRPRSVLSRAPVAPGEWTHVAGVWDGKGIALYLDGELEGYEPTRGSTRLRTPRVARLGRALGGGQVFEGAVAELRIWDRALSQGELRRAMGRDLAELDFESGPVRHWRFDAAASPRSPNVDGSPESSS